MTAPSVIEHNELIARLENLEDRIEDLDEEVARTRNEAYDYSLELRNTLTGYNAEFARLQDRIEGLVLAYEDLNERHHLLLTAFQAYVNSPGSPYQAALDAKQILYPEEPAE